MHINRTPTKCNFSHIKKCSLHARTGEDVACVIFLFYIRIYNKFAIGKMRIISLYFFHMKICVFSSSVGGFYEQLGVKVFFFTTITYLRNARANFSYVKFNRKINYVTCGWHIPCLFCWICIIKWLRIQIQQWIEKQ